jgi:hypothetical protein
MHIMRIYLSNFLKKLIKQKSRCLDAGFIILCHRAARHIQCRQAHGRTTAFACSYFTSNITGFAYYQNNLKKRPTTDDNAPLSSKNCKRLFVTATGKINGTFK